jgi:N-carbamoylputrescine amidase
MGEVEKRRIRGQESLVNIACGQFEPHVGFLEENREKTLRIIDEAAKQKVRFIVFPELCNTGYVFNTREEARSLCEPVPGGKTIQLWEEAAKEYDMYIAAGFGEKEGIHLYNSAVLIGPEGYIGKYRKLHLWYEEKLFFEPGNLGIPVFETPIGRIGLQICYDQWFVEVTRILALQGADLIAGPTNWVPINENEHPDNLEKTGQMPMANHIAMVNAHVNTVWIAYCDRVGIERGQPFLGSSIICNPSGLPVAGPASVKKEELIVAKQCNLLDARKKKAWNNLNVMPRDRRADVYDVMLGYQGAKPYPF